MINATLVASALVFSQAGVPAMIETTSPVAALPDQTRDVAYEAITAGRADEAVERIEEHLRELPEDPALLINLAAAHLGRGEYQLAADAYRRAAASDERYLVELADGSWMDSRQAARRGLRAIEGQLLAAR